MPGICQFSVLPRMARNFFFFFFCPMYLPTLGCNHPHAWSNGMGQSSPEFWNTTPPAMNTCSNGNLFLACFPATGVEYLVRTVLAFFFFFSFFLFFFLSLCGHPGIPGGAWLGTRAEFLPQSQAVYPQSSRDRNKCPHFLQKMPKKT